MIDPPFATRVFRAKRYRRAVNELGQVVGDCFQVQGRPGIYRYAAIDDQDSFFAIIVHSEKCCSLAPLEPESVDLIYDWLSYDK